MHHRKEIGGYVEDDTRYHQGDASLQTLLFPHIDFASASRAVCKSAAVVFPFGKVEKLMTDGA
jgi:hypothetical protein